MKFLTCFFFCPSLFYQSLGNNTPLVTALVVLCEQEFLCIDLTDPNWPVLDLPYLNPIHSSQVMCILHSSEVEEHVWKV